MNMKRNISKLLIGVCLSSSMLINTGCIEETFPTNAATEDQVTSSEEAAGAMLWSMHAMLNTYAIDVDRSRHFDWGYGSIMYKLATCPFLLQVMTTIGHGKKTYIKVKAIFIINSYGTSIGEMY